VAPRGRAGGLALRWRPFKPPRVQSKRNDYCAPLTSFDWNHVDNNLLVTSSIDTTCSLWDIEVRDTPTARALRCGR